VLLLLLGALSFEVATARNATFTLDQVNAQVSSFLNGIQNGRLSSRGISPRSFLPARCELAVRQPPFLENHLLRTEKCDFLNFTLPGRISYPQSPIYHYEESRYWSQQQAASAPTCRFSPESASDVSQAVLTTQVSRCEFAIKSGGHAAFAGASNIERRHGH
jgi:hypothetical protein